MVVSTRTGTTESRGSAPPDLVLTANRPRFARANGPLHQAVSA
jgi:hypothetical protein